MSDKDNKALYERYFSPCLAKSTHLMIERGQGPYLFTSEGGRYLDLVQGIAVNALGHGHPEVLAAAKVQMDKIVHGSFNLADFEPTLELGRTLAGLSPEGIEMFFLTNSGAEAVEGCLKLARQVSGRSSYLAFRGGFHGRTWGAASITSSSVRFRQGYAPFLPQVYFSPYPYCFRCPFGREEESCSLECLRSIETDFLTIIPAQEVAAAIFEPVLGEGGYVVPPAKYVRGLRELCDRHGILLVFDEVQTGIGRTGKLFASEHYGVVPDAMSLGKALGGGFPLGVVASTPELMGRWETGAHGTTFGGHPVASATALAVLGRVSEPDFLAGVEKLGQRFREGLMELQSAHPGLDDVRGLGLMNAVELTKDGREPDPERATKVVEFLREEKKILVLTCGLYKNVVRFIPPLNLEPELLDQVLEGLDQALESTARSKKGS